MINNHKTYEMYRKIVLCLLGNKCEKCGSDYRLAVHHKDYNHNNNKRENLIMLCHKCHSIEHDNDHKKIRTEHLKLKCPYCTKEILGFTKNQIESLSYSHVANKHKGKDSEYWDLVQNNKLKIEELK